MTFLNILDMIKTEMPDDTHEKSCEKLAEPNIEEKKNNNEFKFKMTYIETECVLHCHGMPDGSPPHLKNIDMSTKSPRIKTMTSHVAKDKCLKAKEQFENKTSYDERVIDNHETFSLL